MLWQENAGIFLLPYHLQRLEHSAHFFKFPCNINAIQKQLLATSNHLSETAPTTNKKTRLLLDKNGNTTIQSPLLIPLNIQTVGFATHPIQSDNIYLQHKTTIRHMYTTAKASRPDTDDVILWNEKGEITEASSSNIVVEINGQKYTPPVKSGLLAGTFRAHLLDQKIIQEKTIHKTQLPSCEKIYLINSVRQWREVELIQENPHK